MGANHGAESAYPTGAPEFNPGFQWGSCYSIFRFICIFWKIENDPEQLAHTRENSPALAYPRLIADLLNLNQVRQEQPNLTWSLPFQPPILN
jgi:hypothetical protein